MSIASNFPSSLPSLLLDFANVKRLDPRITFTRTTTATYYDGVTTAKAEENLLLQSQTFDSSWLLTNNASISANTAAAPDGTTTADTVSATASSITTATPTQTYQFVNATNGLTYTASVYAKAANSNFVYFREFFSHNTEDVTWFNLSTGAVGTTNANHTASIVNVGNGWYRCIITTTSNGTRSQSLGIGVTTSNGSFDVTTTSSIYIWGAQLEQRSSATAYTATTTQAITNYIPVLQTAAAGQARFDHNPTTGESLGLLIEEARTNVCLQSEDFNTGWTLGSSTVSTNATIAPNGTLTADKIIPSSTGANRGLFRTFTASGATTVSVYAKYGGYQWFNVIKPDGSNIGVSFDILNGVKGTEQSGVTGTITSVGNGWYRCTCTQTYTGTAYVQLGVASADNSTTVTVATNDVLSGTFIWGAQAETSGSSFATSYIPTTGSTATRNADAASMTGTNFSSWFNNGEGTVYWDRRRTNTSASPEITIYNRTVATAFYNGSIAFINTASSGTITVSSLANGVLQASVTTSTGLTGTGSVKTAYAYKANDFAGSSNGQSAGTDTSGILQTGVDTLAFFTSGANGFQHLGKFAYYPIRLTNAQLQALTV